MGWATPETRLDCRGSGGFWGCGGGGGFQRYDDQGPLEAPKAAPRSEEEAAVKEATTEEASAAAEAVPATRTWG